MPLLDCDVHCTSLPRSLSNIESLCIGIEVHRGIFLSIFFNQVTFQAKMAKLDSLRYPLNLFQSSMNKFVMFIISNCDFSAMTCEISSAVKKYMNYQNQTLDLCLKKREYLYIIYQIKVSRILL